MSDSVESRDKTDQESMVGEHVLAVESESEAYRGVGNAKAVLSDIPKDELSDREGRRLRTIYKKLNEVEDIMAERLAEEHDDV